MKTVLQLNGVNVNCVMNEVSWRLVHDGARVIGLVHSSGCTRSAHQVFTAATKIECDAEIARLGLEQ